MVKVRITVQRSVYRSSYIDKMLSSVVRPNTRRCEPKWLGLGYPSGRALRNIHGPKADVQEVLGFGLSQRLGVRVRPKA